MANKVNDVAHAKLTQNDSSAEPLNGEGLNFLEEYGNGIQCKNLCEMF